MLEKLPRSLSKRSFLARTTIQPLWSSRLQRRKIALSSPRMTQRKSKLMPKFIQKLSNSIKLRTSPGATRISFKICRLAA